MLAQSNDAEIVLQKSKKPRRGFAKLGPGVLIAAAFIGPGTVLAASVGGARFGNTLLWAIGFSILATMVLQEMAARLGIVTGLGLSQAIGQTIPSRTWRIGSLGLVLLAILVGNAAYQTGNLLGAADGAQVLFEPNPAGANVVASNGEAANVEVLPAEFAFGTWSLKQVLLCSMAGVALVVIGIGRFDVLQGALSVLVGLMSLLFVVAAVNCQPDWTSVLAGFRPRVPVGADWLVVALIGTTVVPYNLFLHASAAAERWGKTMPGDPLTETADESSARIGEALMASRWDTVVSVGVGGLVTAAIMITAATAFYKADQGEPHVLQNAKEVAIQLEPAIGSWAKQFFAMGLLAAGLTSSITAPIAAGYATAGCFGWSGKLSDWRLKLVAMAVVIVGLSFGLLFEKSPLQTIVVAQLANGLLLPVVAIYLLMVINRPTLMGRFTSGWISNGLAVLVIAVTFLFAANQLKSGWSKLGSFRSVRVGAVQPLLQNTRILDDAESQCDSKSRVDVLDQLK